MANDNRNRTSSSSSRDERNDAPAAEPWNLMRICQSARRDGEVVEEWVQCGVAWPMKKSEGFTFTLYFALPEGARMAIMPRKNGGGR